MKRSLRLQLSLLAVVLLFLAFISAYNGLSIGVYLAVCACAIGYDIIGKEEQQ